MLAVTLQLRAGHRADAPRVFALLAAAGLPMSDLAPEDLSQFIVAQDAQDGAASTVVGAVGIEVHGEAALLRSLVVDPDWRGSGVGGALVSAAERRSRELSMASVTLLTQTATEYFLDRGYRAIVRSVAPASLQTTTEFTTLCPASSVCLHKALSPTNAIHR